MIARKKEISVFVAAGPEAIKTVLPLVERSERLMSIGVATDGEGAIQDLQTTQAEIALIDFSLPGVSGAKVIEFISRIRHDIKFVMMSHSEETDQFRRAMFAGAREFINLPTTTARLESSLERVAQIKATKPKTRFPEAEKIASKHRKDEKLIAVCGAKGGVGASSVAANLALSLAGRHGLLAVSIAELTPGIGDMETIFDIEQEKNLSDLIPVLDELDPGVIRSAATNIREDLDLYCAPKCVREESKLTDGQVGTVLRALRYEYDLTIVDVGPNMLGYSETVFETSDLILIVMTPDILSYRSAERSIEFLKKSGIDLNKVQVAVNRAGPSGLSAKRISRHLQIDVIGIIPENPRLRESIDSGRLSAFEPPEVGPEWAALVAAAKEKLQLLEEIGSR